jgi:hypothetical protein
MTIASLNAALNGKFVGQRRKIAAFQREEIPVGKKPPKEKTPGVSQGFPGTACPDEWFPTHPLPCD